MMAKVVKLPHTKQVEFGGLTLQLRLGAKDILQIEGRLNESMMGLFMNGQGGMGLPSTNKLLTVLQGANQVSGVTDKHILEAFEKFLDEGNTTMDVMTIIQELLDESGFFGKDKPKEVGELKEEAVDFMAMD